MMNIISLIISYLLGSISFALIIGKVFYKIDVREHGSGNLGATNTIRVLGKKPGIIVAIGDLLKGTVACCVPLLFHTNINPIFYGILAILGHVYPIFAGFRGGKAVATSAGVLLYLTPIGTLVGVIVFVIVLLSSKYVSLGSIFASISIFIYSVFSGDKFVIGLSLFICLFIIYRHKGNIKKIFNGTESKIGKKQNN